MINNTINCTNEIFRSDIYMCPFISNWLFSFRSYKHKTLRKIKEAKAQKQKQNYRRGIYNNHALIPQSQVTTTMYFNFYFCMYTVTLVTSSVSINKTKNKKLFCCNCSFYEESCNCSYV